MQQVVDVIDDLDHECPGGCGGPPAWGCHCRDDGEQYRVPRTQWPDADRAAAVRSRTAASATGAHRPRTIRRSTQMSGGPTADDTANRERDYHVG